MKSIISEEVRKYIKEEIPRLTGYQWGRDGAILCFNELAERLSKLGMEDKEICDRLYEIYDAVLINVIEPNPL